MAAGDLITRNYQYEFNGILMGSNTAYTVEGLEGLWAMPELRTADIERNDAHGDIPGEDLMGPRTLEADIKVTADTQIAMETAMMAVAKAMRPRTDEAEFVWQRPGQVKKFVKCRPRKRSFPSNFEMARGLATGSVVLYAPDPVIYSLAERTSNINLAAGVASGSTTWTSQGDFETWPRFTLTGAGSNPRFSNNQESGRQVRIDVVMAAGDTLVVDTHPDRRTVTLNGVDRYDLVRTDNQWWRLFAATNTITFSRTDTTGSQSLAIAGRDGWV